MIQHKLRPSTDSKEFIGQGSQILAFILMREVGTEWDERSCPIRTPWATSSCTLSPPPKMKVRLA